MQLLLLDKFYVSLLDFLPTLQRKFFLMCTAIRFNKCLLSRHFLVFLRLSWMLISRFLCSILLCSYIQMCVCVCVCACVSCVFYSCRTIVSWSCWPVPESKWKLSYLIKYLLDIGNTNKEPQTYKMQFFMPMHSIWMNISFSVTGITWYIYEVTYRYVCVLLKAILKHHKQLFHISFHVNSKCSVRCNWLWWLGKQYYTTNATHLYMWRYMAVIMFLIIVSAQLKQLNTGLADDLAMNRWHMPLP